MEERRGRCIDPRLFELGNSWRRLVSFTPRPLFSGERAPDTHWIGDWVDPKAGLNDMKKLKFLNILGL
jgi:hypothetical protein